MAMGDRQYAHDAKPKLLYQAKFDRDINEVGIQSGPIAPFVHASAIRTEQSFALLQHSEGWLPLTGYGWCWWRSQAPTSLLTSRCCWTCVVEASS